MTMERRLGRFEHAWVLSSQSAPLAVVVVVRLQPAPSPAALRDALDAAQQAHPLLRCRIEQRGRHLWFTDRIPTKIPLTVTPRRSESHWCAATETLLNTGMDSLAQPMAACTLLAPGDDHAAGEILLAFNHSVIDADSGLALVEGLIGRIAAGPGSGRQSLGEVDALPPAEARFPAPYRGVGGLVRQAVFLMRQLAGELRWQLSAAGCRKPPVYPSPRCRILVRRLSPSVTARLMGATRRRRVTLNSALSAAMLMAVGHHLYGRRTPPLRHITFSGLRPWMTPPPANSRLGCCIGMLRITQCVGGGLGFWDLARAVNAKIYRSAKRGDRFLSALTIVHMMRLALTGRAGRMAATALSTTGIVRPAGDCALQIKGLHCFVSNFSVGPEYAAMARIVSGQLVIDQLYLDRDMRRGTAEAIADEILALLSDNATDA